MRVSVLGSGSRGNAFAVTADGLTLVLDAGFPVRTLQRRARAVQLDLAGLVGVVVTHEHSDHAAGARLLARRHQCPLYASRGTLHELGAAADAAKYESRPLAHLETVEIGPFEVTACQTVHDAVEPLALAVTGPGGERLVLAYDFGRATAALRYLLRGADCLIIESNHDEALLRESPYPVSVRRRIAGPAGHLSNRAAAELLGAACHAGLQTVVLAHLSEICNQKPLATDVARAALRERRYGGALLVAEQDAPLGPIEICA